MSALAEDIKGALIDRARIIDRCRIFGFRPHAKQWRFIEHDTTKNKAMVGANRSGKSALAAIEAICHAWGIRPYLPKDHPHYRVRMPDGEPIGVPNRGQVAGEDFPNGIGEVLWPTFLEWLPPGSFKVFKTERGIVRTIGIDVSGLSHADRSSEIYPWSIITFRAYEQGSQTFEGAKHHWIFDDEPPPRKIWVAQTRGLVDWGGKWMGAMTCVDAQHTWIYDMFMPPKGRAKSSEFDEVFQAAFRNEDFYLVPVSIWDNLKSGDGVGGLTEQNIRAYADSLDEDPVTQAVRIEGKPLHLMATEFGNVWDPEVNVVPHVEPSAECCHVTLCDAHPTKPYAILFAEVDEHDQWYIWGESYSERLDSIDKIADFIKETECWDRNRSGNWIPGTGPFESQMRLIDPLAKTKEKGIGMSAVQQFALDHELYWTPWRRGNKANRNRRLKEWLRKGKGPRAQPRILISEQCDELIFQVPRYREKMPKDPDQQPRTGEMVDVDADLVQGLIALASSGITYNMLAGMRGRIIDPDEEIWDYSRRARAVGGY